MSKLRASKPITQGSFYLISLGVCVCGGGGHIILDAIFNGSVYSRQVVHLFPDINVEFFLFGIV